MAEKLRQDNKFQYHCLRHKVDRFSISVTR